MIANNDKTMNYWTGWTDEKKHEVNGEKHDIRRFVCHYLSVKTIRW